LFYDTACATKGKVEGTQLKLQEAHTLDL
jgi:hypothetical protein